ncbi:cobaltochelatase subunit CobN [Dyadobacter crusticola]|uniref:cobaltochelatase subunit CobN n=1 Tax=Dyadobacter crusticola TaxID=292407 RepID=UPI0004E214C0|nr:cobaltochelatase subunit CobN [Dyadobacter crusticola]
MKNLLFTFLLLAVLWLPAHAQIRVSLVLSDNYTKTGYDVTQKLKLLSGFSTKCDVKIFPQEGFADTDLGFLEKSDIIFVYVHNAGVFEQAKPQLLTAIKDGAKVYALGGTPAEDVYKSQGVIFNASVLKYFEESSTENIKNMVLSRLDVDQKVKFPYREVIKYADAGIYSLARDSIFTDRDAFIKNYKNYRPGKPWVGFYVFRYEMLTGQHQYLDTHIQYLERAGFNVMPFYGFPLGNSLKKFCMDSAGKATINFLVSASSLPGSSPEDLRLVFEKLGVPVISAIQLDQSREAWEKSAIGLSVFNRTMSLTRPEMTGQVQPTVTTSQESKTYPGGIQVSEKVAIENRVQRLVDRISAWNRLQTKANHDKNIALIYYNNPPGKENIGASYLNVLPQSMHSILARLGKEGYDLGKSMPDSNKIYDDVMGNGRNIGSWAPAEMDRMVREGKPVLIPLSEYQEMFEKLSTKLKNEVLKKWGQPDTAKIMTWQNASGENFLVLPAVWYGKILLTPQPARGWNQDLTSMYHDLTLPPHHQYIAFYLWLQKKFRADAIINLGTHGTHEWLSGKEAGLNDDDAPEALIGDLINIYPYIVDDVGEGLQAKRRGMAVIIDYLTPPFDKAGLNSELKELAGLITDYTSATEKSEALAQSKLNEIKRLTAKLGLMKDLGLSDAFTDDQLEELEHYIRDIGEKQTPFGMHTFGKSPSAENAARTAEAIVDRQKDLKTAERDSLITDLSNKILASGDSEMNALVAALNGKYIRAGQGNDPLRNPQSLPTGKNFFAFDPSKVPSKETYNMGSKLAEELIAGYQKAHKGEFPDKVTLNLWSTETIRHEGVMESQILKLMGVRPKYDAFGRVKGIEIIPQTQLNRPRVDVVMVPSGLYRDMFPNLMELMDQAVVLAKAQDEPDNYLRQHIALAKEKLVDQGVKEELAERLASVRLFSVPSGAYGTGIENAVEASGTWDKESQVADVYFNRMSHLYGQGFWGDKPETADSTLTSNLSIQLLKTTLSGTKTVVHSRSSNVYGALDNDDFYQYLGATAMAVRSIDGKSPDVTVTNLADPNQMGQESLDKYIGREMKTRYLNPKWINEMLGEGYSGARMINKVVEHLWGWQVTVPEAIDENKWQQMYDTYVEDQYGLDIKQKFRDAKNMYAYQTTLSRMLEVVRKDYWHPDEKVTENLIKEYMNTVAEVGLSCNGNVCDNSTLTGFISDKMQNIQGVTAAQYTSYSKQLSDIRTNPGISQPTKTAQQSKPSARPASKPVSQHNAAASSKPADQNPGEVRGYKMEEVVKQTNAKASNQKPVQPTKTALFWMIAAMTIAFFAGKQWKTDS